MDEKLASIADFSYTPEIQNSTSGTEKAAFRRPRVLICEDDPATLLQLKYTFQELGCDVTPLALGSAAFFRLETERFDLVLMDFSVPFMDADQVIDEMLPWTRITTPFVLMSADDHRADTQKFGFLDFYPKPITVPVAETMLQRFIGPFGPVPADHAKREKTLAAGAEDGFRKVA